MTKYGRLDARDAAKLGYLPAKVLLNGEEIQGVTVIDDVEGWIDVYPKDEKGEREPVWDESIDGPKIERLYGTVTYLPNIDKYNLPLECRIEDGVVTIRIGVGTLTYAFEESDENNQWDEDSGDFKRTYHIADAHEFAKDVVLELTREEEDGTTPLHLLFDKACQEAVRTVKLCLGESHGNCKKSSIL